MLLSTQSGPKLAKLADLHGRVAITQAPPTIAHAWAASSRPRSSATIAAVSVESAANASANVIAFFTDSLIPHLPRRCFPPASRNGRHAVRHIGGSPVSGHFPTSSDTQASFRNLQTDVVTNPATAMPSD